MMDRRCKGCNFPMTWAAQRVQFGRLKKLNCPMYKVNDLMPRCQKCMTKAIGFIEKLIVTHGGKLHETAMLDTSGLEKR